MILVSQYGDGGRMERVLVERPAGDAAERKFDLQTQDRPEYFTLSGTGVVRYFSWEGREFKTASVSFIDPDAMNIGNNVQQKPCIPNESSLQQQWNSFDCTINSMHSKTIPNLSGWGLQGGRTLPGCKQSKGIETLTPDWSYWMNWGSLPRQS